MSKLETNSKLDTNGGFVEQWFKSRVVDSKADQHVLDLIRKHCKNSELNEEGLYKDLIILSEKMGS